MNKREDFVKIVDELIAESGPGLSSEQTLTFIDGKFFMDGQSMAKLVSEGGLAEKLPEGCACETTEQRILKLVNKAPVMLFMKGSPDNPQCGFSKTMIALLNGFVGSVITGYDHFDVYTDEEIREGIKKHTKWPTIPQLFVKG